MEEQQLMDEHLKADEFVHTSVSGETTPGREFLKTLGFDPDACEITVVRGLLVFRQEDHRYGPLTQRFWRRVPPPK